MLHISLLLLLLLTCTAPVLIQNRLKIEQIRKCCESFSVLGLESSPDSRTSFPRNRGGSMSLANRGELGRSSKAVKVFFPSHNHECNIIVNLNIIPNIVFNI